MLSLAYLLFGAAVTALLLAMFGQPANQGLYFTLFCWSFGFAALFVFPWGAIFSGMANQGGVRHAAPAGGGGPGLGSLILSFVTRILVRVGSAAVFLLRTLALWLFGLARRFPLATVTIILWLVVLGCLLGFYQADEPFLWLALLAVAFHAAVACSLAWGGKLEEAFEKASLVAVWAYASVWAMVLTGAYGYEDGFLDWWWYPPFLFAFISLLLAGVVMAGLHKKAFEALGKAYFEWHGTGSMILWGLTLMIVPFLLYTMTGHEFFDMDTKEMAFNLKWVVAAGFFLLVFSPVFFLAKKVK